MTGIQGTHAGLAGCLLLAASIAVANVGIAQEAPEIETRVYQTLRLAGDAPIIDGVPDDPVWAAVDWSSDFVQRDPKDGDPPAHQTRFKVLYDDDAIYFAFHMDDDPEQVTNMLARRDRFPGDWIEINIDSYGDHRTAFSFTLSLSGTRGDEFISNDGHDWDSSWDPVWTGAARVNGKGWTAESKIPLSQLRFSAAPEQTWGLQVQRRLFRLEERSTWQRIPKDVSGWVSRFGELRGIEDLKPKRRFELLPYGVVSGERFEAEADDPFTDGQEGELNLGLDGKIGITNNLTLDFTVNPDFGQVEADPSEVNLTEFETFFEEKRPFFIEGRNIYDLPLAPAITGGSFVRDNLFYSRRIGRPPTYWPDGDYVDMPQFTRILGAFKLSGKTANGLSVGLLDSLTSEEEARVDTGGESTRVTVEPLTNYFVGRLQQDYRGGDTQIGGMLTAVKRRIDQEHLDFMVEDAYTGGLDLSSYFANRDYRLEGSVIASQVRGSEEAIEEVQTSSARYYQRPDNESAALDPTRTSLSGHGGSVRLTRTSNHELVFQTGMAWRSPGFEINDLGYMRNADQINQFTWVGYQKRNPVGIFDRWALNGNQWLDWDFAGNFLGAAFNVNTNAQFLNKYSAGGGITRRNESTSNTELRGGPSSVWPGSWAYSAWVNSDQRKDFTFSGEGYLRHSDEGSGTYWEAWATLAYRPSNAIRVSLSPGYMKSTPEMQYVDTTAFGDDDRYLFGSLDQRTIVLTLRLDYSITPNLTVQYYGSPFLSTGRYTEFKRITRPKADDYRDRFHVFDEQQIAYDPDNEIYEVDENRDGSVDYEFEDPDFDAREFNSNLVIRWEYQPGSTLFVVWSQIRQNSTMVGEHLEFQNDMRELFSAPPHNVLLVKISKWLSL